MGHAGVLNVAKWRGVWAGVTFVGDPLATLKARRLVQETSCVHHFYHGLSGIWEAATATKSPGWAVSTFGSA